MREPPWQSALLARRPSRHRLGRGLVFAAFLAGLAARTVSAATFTASLDRGVISLGESVTLSLTFEGGTPQNVPTPPGIPNLEISYVGPSSQFSFINGRVSSTVTHNFTLTPQRVGRYTIPALSAVVGGQRLATRPLELTVLPPNAPPPAAINSGSQPAFLRLVVPKKDIYLGEVVPAELQLYLSQSVQNIDRFNLTAVPADGFNVGKMVQGARRRVQVGNGIYTMIPLQFTLAPVRTGALNIGPITASIVVELPSGNQRVDPFMNPFGMFNNNVQKQLALATETAAVRALPLPTRGAPDHFNGAVGDYTMSVTAGPTNVAVGDPITVHVQISGSGALDGLTLPRQSAWKNFQIYPPTAKVRTSDQLGLLGAKTFEEIVVPQSADVKSLPAFSFSFFDPDRKAFRTLTQPAIPLVVRPAGSTPTPTIAAAGPQNSPPPAQDIVYIKQRLGALAQLGPPLTQQSWFLGLQSVPVLALLGAVTWRKRADKLANNPRLRRRRHVAQIVRDGLGELRRAAAENKSDAFFAIVSRLLQEQLGERLDVPASAITDGVVEEALKPRGVPEPVLEGVRELFQSCNLARFAPVKSSQELAALIPQVEAVLRQVQELEL